MMKNDIDKQIRVAERIGEVVGKSFDPIRDLSGDSSSGWDSEVKAFMDSVTLKSLFFSENWVFIVVDVIATKIANQQMKVVQRTVEDGKEIFTPADDHPLNDLMRTPNQYQSYYTWMYNQIVEYILMGNDMVWASKGSGQLMILPTEQVLLKFNNKSELDKYQFIIRSGYSGMDAPVVSSMEFPAEEIIHVRKPNPNSVYWGLSPFVPGRKGVLFNRYTSDYLNNFYLKNALPGFSLTMEKHANEDVMLRLLRSFEKAYTGRRNQRRTIVIPKGVKGESVEQKIADQSLIELIGLNREDIINLLKVPKHELSLAESGSLGSEEHKVALKNFWSTTLIPTMSAIEESYTTFFAKELGEDHVFKFDIHGVSILKEDEFKQAELADKLLSTHTLNEVRAKVYDMEPVDGGDKTPGVTASVSATTQVPPPNVEEEEEPEEEETKMVENNTSKDIKSQYIGWIEYSMKEAQDHVEGLELKFVDKILAMFADIAEKTMEVVSKELEDETEEDPVEKAAKPRDKKAMQRIRSALIKAHSDMTNEWIDFQVNLLMNTVDQFYDIQLKPVFNEVDHEALEAIRERDNEKRRGILQMRSIDTFENVSKTTTEKVMKIIEKGIAKGLTIDKITPMIAEKLVSVDEDEALRRARTIARTETLTAVSVGKAAAMRNVKEILPDVKKQWITANDERVRDTHVDNEEMGPLDMEEKFSNGLKFPRDPSGAPEETINCRCDILMLPPEQAKGKIL